MLLLETFNQFKQTSQEVEDSQEELNSLMRQLNNGEQYAMISGNFIVTKKYFASPQASQIATHNTLPTIWKIGQIFTINGEYKDKLTWTK